LKKNLVFYRANKQCEGETEMSFDKEEKVIVLENPKDPDCQGVLDLRNPDLPCYKCPNLLKCQFEKITSE